LFDTEPVLDNTVLHDPFMVKANSTKSPPSGLLPTGATDTESKSPLGGLLQEEVTESAQKYDDLSKSPLGGLLPTEPEEIMARKTEIAPIPDDTPTVLRMEDTSDATPMTVSEALIAVDLLKSKIAESAIVLYDFRNRKGWVAMGLPSFDVFIDTVLHMEKTTVYNWMARVKATLVVKDASIEQYLEDPSTKLISQSNAIMLVRLKEPDLMRVAWTEIEGLRSIGARMKHEYTKELGRIVNRLIEQHPEIAAQQPKKKSKTESAAMSDAPLPTPSVSQKEFKEPVSVVSPSMGADDEDENDYDTQLAQELTAAATTSISETATDVLFDGGWLIVRFEEAGRVPVSLKFDVVHRQEAIFTSSLFIRAQAVE
jgi:hypothetical protein